MRRGLTTACGGRAIGKSFIIEVEGVPLMPGVGRLRRVTTKIEVERNFSQPRTASGKGDRIMKKVSLTMIALVSLGIPSEIARVRSASYLSKKQTHTMQQARSVKGQVLTSTENPAVRLKFGGEFKYVGNQTFILYDVARAEQHFFVDADAQGRIKRFYWVQFEGYLPNNTEAYDYKVNKTVSLGGLDFIADAYARNIKANPGRPDSDGNRARAFLERKGYRMASDDIMSQRLVHLIGKEKRNELMIIYIEDMSGMGLMAADVAAEGRAAARWDEISKGLLHRAMKYIKISRSRP
jgi:hypothetical protein